MSRLTGNEIFFLIGIAFLVLLFAINPPGADVMGCLLLIIVLTGVFVYFTIIGPRSIWPGLAQRAGLQFHQGSLFGIGMKINGNYRGHWLSLYVENRENEYTDSNFNFTILIMTFSRRAPLAMKIDRHFPSGKPVKAPNIQIGDRELDENFTVKGQPEETVRRLLTSPAVRQKLLEVPSLHLEVAQARLYQETSGIEGDEEKLLAMFDLLASLADELEQMPG